MATIKSYTDISQSETLSSILLLESADMFYCYGMNIDTKKCDYDTVPTIIDADNQIDICDIPCWSLSALLGILPVTATLLKNGNISNTGDIKYNCESSMVNIHKWFDNPVDACVAMIEKLHKLNML